MAAEGMASGLQFLIYIVPVVALIVSIITFLCANRERHEKSAAEQAGIKANLDSIAKHVEDIDSRTETLVNGQAVTNQNVAALDTRVGALETRVDGLETRIMHTEDRINNLHQGM